MVCLWPGSGLEQLRMEGRALAQAVRLRLPTAAARVPAQVMLRDLRWI
jgi:hypothetical protein